MFEYLPERPIEPPEEKSIAYCDYCGGEIYEGETVYKHRRAAHPRRLLARLRR